MVHVRQQRASQRQPGLARRLMFVAAISLCACTETEPVLSGARPMKTANAGPSYNIQVTDSTSNYFSADVTNSVSGPREGWTRADAYSQTNSHVTRTLNSDGVTWSSNTGVDSLQRMPVEQTGGIYHPDFATVASNGSGSDPVLYDRNGNGVSTTVGSASGVDLAPGVSQSQVTPSGDATANSWPSPSSGTAGSVSFSRLAPPGGTAARANGAAGVPSATLLSAAPIRDPRAWIDNIVIGPEARARWADRLSRKFGKVAGIVAGHDQYLLQTGDRLIEVLVDRGIGAPVEENLVVGGQLRAHTTYAFQQVRSGIFVKTLTRTELAGRQPGDNVVFTSRLTNVVLQHR